MTVVDRILSFLKDNSGQEFTPKEIALSINANPNTVRGRLSELTRGLVKRVRVTKLKKKKGQRRSEWRLPEGQASRLSDFKLYRVSFKIIDTHKKRWKSENMNFESYADGIVDREISEDEILEIAGSRLETESLKIINESIPVGTNIKDAFLGIQVLNNNPLDEKYNPKWIGEAEIIFSSGFVETQPIFYRIKKGAWD